MFLSTKPTSMIRFGSFRNPVSSRYPIRQIWVIFPAEAFLSCPSVCILQATSPRGDRWKTWHKERAAEKYIMDIWTKSGHVGLAYVVALKDKPVVWYFGYSVIRQRDPKDLLEAAARWGASPRVLLNLLSGQITEEDLEADARYAIVALCNNPMLSIVQVKPLDIHNDVLSKIIWTRPRRANGRIDPRFATPWIPSAHVAARISEQLMKVDAHLQADFFARMSGHPWSRSAAGWMFEAWVHTFMSETEITCSWNHQPSGRSLSEIIPSMKRETLRDLKDAEMSTSFYWRPPGTKFPGVDAVLCVERVLYALQATISSTHHSAEPGLEEISKRLKAPFKKLPWCLLFVNATEDSARQLGTTPRLTQVVD